MKLAKKTCEKNCDIGKKCETAIKKNLVKLTTKICEIDEKISKIDDKNFVKLTKKINEIDTKNSVKFTKKNLVKL